MICNSYFSYLGGRIEFEPFMFFGELENDGKSRSEKTCDKHFNLIMESRLQLDSRIHFFEYYSLDKFEESLRNALLYSIDIITQTDRFVHLHQYSKEIALVIEIAINIPYSLKYNASYSEYFYGFSLSNKQNWIKRVGILITRLLYPYLMLKFSNYIN